jgi:uncharacterized membrane protein YoaK (UPF0700 family)
MKPIIIPIKYARRHSVSKRSTESNRHLGFTLAFVAGGVIGAIGFKFIGYALTIPLALLLVLLAAVPAIDDLRVYLRRCQEKKPPL